MKARLLTKLMNDCGYTPSNRKKYIAMGSPLCHDLISVDKETLNIKYALDTYRQGRECLADKGNETLLFVWDKFQELIDTGEIHDIINGNDEIENKLPVWTFYDGQLIETHTDVYGWPNTTYTGEIMYDNTHFKTRDEAISKGLSEYEAGVNIATRRIDEIEADLKKAKDWLAKEQAAVNHFKSLKA